MIRLAHKGWLAALLLACAWPAAAHDRDRTSVFVGVDGWFFGVDNGYHGQRYYPRYRWNNGWHYGNYPRYHHYDRYGYRYGNPRYRDRWDDRRWRDHRGRDSRWRDDRRDHRWRDDRRDRRWRDHRDDDRRRRYRDND